MRRAVAFLTLFGRSAAPAPGAVPWFPVVGALLGLAVGWAWWAARRVWAPPAAAAVAVAVDAVLTGCLHLDGLADAADGLLPPLPRDRRLAVMADPRVGAVGASVLGTVLLLRFAGFAGAAPAPLTVAGLWAGARGAAAVTARTLPYARPGGLVSGFLGAGGWLAPAAVAALLAGGLGWAGRAGHGLAAVGVALVAAAGVVALARRRLGGFTGDVLGATIVVAETAGMLTLAARW